MKSTNHLASIIGAVVVTAALASYAIAGPGHPRHRAQTREMRLRNFDNDAMTRRELKQADDFFVNDAKGNVREDRHGKTVDNLRTSVETASQKTSWVQNATAHHRKPRPKPVPSATPGGTHPSPSPIPSATPGGGSSGGPANPIPTEPPVDPSPEPSIAATRPPIDIVGPGPN